MKPTPSIHVCCIEHDGRRPIHLFHYGQGGSICKIEQIKQRNGRGRLLDIRLCSAKYFVQEPASRGARSVLALHGRLLCAILMVLALGLSCVTPVRTHTVPGRNSLIHARRTTCQSVDGAGPSQASLHAVQLDYQQVACPLFYRYKEYNATL
jgi:hypothetical protein